MKLAAIDFETANEHIESACAIGIVTIDEGVIEEEYYTLIKPHPDYNYFSSFNIQIHHIKPEDVKKEKEFNEIYYEQIYPLLNDSLIMAHNAKFDMAVLKGICRVYGLDMPNCKYFDTVELGRKLFPHLKHHKLNDLCEHLNVSLDHHNAASDAYGCAMILVNSMILSEEFDAVKLLDSCRCHIYEGNE